MFYKIRVTLSGIKGFFRVYAVNSENSLYTFHKQLQSDLEFPSDQPILFKALGADGAVTARYALVDLGAGTVDTVTFAKAIKDGALSFVYFYDIQAKKNVIVTLEEEYPAKVLIPTLLESKGPVPLEFENGYVAFEDLPQEKRVLPGEKHSIPGLEYFDDDDGDIDDEEEEEVEDKEEEELVYEEDE